VSEKARDGVKVTMGSGRCGKTAPRYLTSRSVGAMRQDGAAELRYVTSRDFVQLGFQGTTVREGGEASREKIVRSEVRSDGIKLYIELGAY